VVVARCGVVSQRVNTDLDGLSLTIPSPESTTTPRINNQQVERANALNKLLVDCNFPSICIHSRMSQDERCVSPPSLALFIASLCALHSKARETFGPCAIQT